MVVKNQHWPALLASHQCCWCCECCQSLTVTFSSLMMAKLLGEKITNICSLWKVRILKDHSSSVRHGHWKIMSWTQWLLVNHGWAAGWQSYSNHQGIASQKHSKEHRERHSAKQNKPQQQCKKRSKHAQFLTCIWNYDNLRTLIFAWAPTASTQHVLCVCGVCIGRRQCSSQRSRRHEAREGLSLFFASICKLVIIDCAARTASMVPLKACWFLSPASRISMAVMEAIRVSSKMSAADFSASDLRPISTNGRSCW